MSQSKKGKTTWQKTRKLFNDIHLWLGLSSGLIVIAICFSGTIYVFNTELTEMAAPHLYKITAVPGMPPMDAEHLIEKVQQEANGRVIAMQIPADPERTYQLSVKNKDDKSRFGTAYMVNPYTGAIVGNSLEKNSTKEFMSTMFSLHRWMLLDKIETPIFSGISNRELGSKISGWATIIFTLGCITGLVIWFPQKLRNWRQGLKIKTRANWKRVNHDLHNSLAFYALFFLLLMGLTGPQWSFEWYRDGLQKTLGTYKPKPGGEGKKSEPEKPSGQGKDIQPTSVNKAPGLHAGNHEKKLAGTIGEPALINDSSASFQAGASEQRLSIAALLNAADNKLPYRGNYNITLADNTDAPVIVSKTRTGFFAPAAADRITLDAFSGEIIKSEIFSDKPFNERVAGSIKAIHVGNVYGTFTKLLYFLACLIATSLPITGTLIWINKLNKKKKKTLRTVQPSAASSELSAVSSQ